MIQKSALTYLARKSIIVSSISSKIAILAYGEFAGGIYTRHIIKSFPLLMSLIFSHIESTCRFDVFHLERTRMCVGKYLIVVPFYVVSSPIVLVRTQQLLSKSVSITK